MDDNDTYVPPIFEPMMEEDRGNAAYMGDSGCDGQNNNPAFKFDGGDCCIAAKQQKGKANGWCKGNDCLCKTMELEVKIGFGDGFNCPFAGCWSSQERTKYINDAMVLAQPYFCHESLGHR